MLGAFNGGSIWVRLIEVNEKGVSYFIKQNCVNNAFYENMGGTTYEKLFQLYFELKADFMSGFILYVL